MAKGHSGLARLKERANHSSKHGYPLIPLSPPHPPLLRSTTDNYVPLSICDWRVRLLDSLIDTARLNCQCGDPGVHNNHKLGDRLSICMCGSLKPRQMKLRVHVCDTLIATD